MSRRHNNANILVLAARRTETHIAREIVAIWLTTAFEGGRHQRRLDKIRRIEDEVRLIYLSIDPKEE
jgi:ribose 5-phosphate isomerase B